MRGRSPLTSSSLAVETFVVGPFPNNLYLLRDDQAREIVVIDPSIESEGAIERVEELIGSGYKLTAIWNTHGHVDHVHDNALWKERFGAPIWMHEADDFLLEYMREQSIFLGLPPATAIPADERFEGGQIAKIGAHEAEILHLPGHSPGSVAFYFEEAGLIISGDVLFAGSVGRTDLPGCDAKQLQDSLRRLARLPHETRVLPGHYDSTTIQAELENNPFYEGMFL